MGKRCIKLNMMNYNFNMIQLKKYFLYLNKVEFT